MSTYKELKDYDEEEIMLNNIHEDSEEEESILNNEPEPSVVNSAVSATLFEWITAVGFIMGGCCSNAYFLELIVKDEPSSGQLITFAQFLLMTVEGFITNLVFDSGVPRLKKRNVPLKRWFLMVILFFSSSLLNNIAFGFDIPMVLHIVFRSGSLFANMFMGWLLLSKRYNIKQITSIAFVTIGVIITTLNTVHQNSKSTNDAAISQQLIGIIILTLALFLASGLSLLAEVTYKKYGKHWKESLFYTHMLALPLFLPFAGEISTSIINYFNSDPITLNGVFSDFLNFIGIAATPKLVLFLVGNIITQYFCISGVHRLSTISSALVLNLMLTLRKMVSIIISVVYLGTPVNSQFILGAILAFSGAFAFSMIKASPPPNQRDDENKIG